MSIMAAKVLSEYLDSEGINHGFLDEEESVIETGFSLKSGGNIRIIIHFMDEERLHLQGMNFMQVPAGKNETMYKICNDLNKTFNWVTFTYREEKNTLVVEDDAIVQLDSVGKEVVELIMRMASIVDQAVPAVMKEIWS